MAYPFRQTESLFQKPGFWEKPGFFSPLVRLLEQTNGWTKANDLIYWHTHFPFQEVLP